MEFQEFLSFFSRSKADRLLGMRCVKYLVGNGGGDGEEKATGCTIEDMMKLIWLKAMTQRSLLIAWIQNFFWTKTGAFCSHVICVADRVRNNALCV